MVTLSHVSGHFSKENFPERRRRQLTTRFRGAETCLGQTVSSDMQVQQQARPLTWRETKPVKPAECLMPMDAEETRVE
jgi:hypothetical protein